jgi:hypothetical protein
METIEMNYEDFNKTFKVLEGAVEGEEFEFQFYGEDYQKIKQVFDNNPRRVWTVVSKGVLGSYITNGLHVVGREAIILTEVPAPPKMRIIVV